MKDLDEFDWLQQWYTEQCNGDWEHAHGISIGNLDNPGWELSIDLADTALASADFPPTSVERSDRDWIQCKVVSGVFQGFGGPNNLRELVDTFRRWVQARMKT